MISFALSEDQALARDSFHATARDLLRPAGRTVEEDGAIPSVILNQIRDLGLNHVQDEASRDPVLNALVFEEMGWGDPSLALAAAGTVAFVQALQAFGTEAQKDAILARLDETGRPAAIAITEPGFDFDVTEMTTKATASDAGYVVDGVKTFVPLAADCAYFLVIAQADDRAQAFIIPSDAPGVGIERMDTLGLRGLALGRVHLSNVTVDAGMRLGGENGCDIQSIIDAARTGTAAVLNGISRAIYEYVRDYTRERFAHGSVLAQKQSVGFRLVDMHIAIESMRWMNWKAASELAASAPATTRSARLAHLYACEQANWIADEGVQLLGGHGFLRDHPVEHWFRATRTLSNLEGLASV